VSRAAALQGDRACRLHVVPSAHDGFADLEAGAIDDATAVIALITALEDDHSLKRLLSASALGVGARHQREHQRPDPAVPAEEDESGPTQADCDRIAAKLNSRPRKRLGFRTPEECYVAAR